MCRAGTRRASDLKGSGVKCPARHGAARREALERL